MGALKTKPTPPAKPVKPVFGQGSVIAPAPQRYQRNRPTTQRSQRQYYRSPQGRGGNITDLWTALGKKQQEQQQQTSAPAAAPAAAAPAAPSLPMGGLKIRPLSGASGGPGAAARFRGKAGSMKRFRTK
jgi:hypothetical protein